MTGRSSNYAFPGTFAGAIRVRASKAGYIDVVKQRRKSERWRQVEQYLGLTMQLSSPYVDMTGSYTLTLTAAGACNLPPEMRTRTYLDKRAA